MSATQPLGAPVWIDVMTPDPKATQDFYSGLFGWEVLDPGPEFGGYFNFLHNGQLIAGGMNNAQDPSMGSFWTTYFSSADAAATVAAAEAAGGAVYLPAQEVSDLGTMAMIAGPGGAPAGIWQAGTHHGFAVRGEPNTPAWFELHSRTYAADMDFYRAVLGWTTVLVSDVDEFRYTLVVDGEEQLAGAMDAVLFPEEAPLGWSVYLGTADAEATIARAVELGATLTIGPDDTPYGILAGFNDPTGAAFKIQQPPAS